MPGDRKAANAEKWLSETLPLAEWRCCSFYQKHAHTASHGHGPEFLCEVRSSNLISANFRQFLLSSLIFLSCCRIVEEGHQGSYQIEGYFPVSHASLIRHAWVYAIRSKTKNSFIFFLWPFSCLDLSLVQSEQAGWRQTENSSRVARG